MFLIILIHCGNIGLDDELVIGKIEKICFEYLFLEMKLCSDLSCIYDVDVVGIVE